MSFAEMMWKSIPENLYIIVFAVIAAVVLVFSFIFARSVEKFGEEGGVQLKRRDYYILEITYTIFITLISIFPLLGMYGTVKALLELDLSGEMSALKANFFQALTSTAWGIIFAVVYKLANSFVQTFIENQITKAKSIFDTPGKDKSAGETGRRAEKDPPAAKEDAAQAETLVPEIRVLEATEIFDAAEVEDYEQTRRNS